MKLTPMMQQFFAAKEQHPDAILFFRMGDFYEMFFEDAVTVSKELGLTLTARNKKNDSEETPMAGVPHHAAAGYIQRLTDKGFSVAICEQLEDPAATKGIVKRDVIRVVTPGMVYDTESIDGKTSNFIAAVFDVDDTYGVAHADVSTGEVSVTTTIGADELFSELHRVGPREILVADDALAETIAARFATAFVRTRDQSTFDPDAVNARVAAGVRLSEDIDHDGYFLSDLSPYLDAGSPERTRAVAAIFDYTIETLRGVPSHIRTPRVYESKQFLILDDATKQNLELTETLMGGHKAGSLLHTIDKTATAQGGRLLRRWISFPLVDQTQIAERLDVVTDFFLRADIRQDVRELLDDVYDLERLCGRIASGSANPKDIKNLGNTLDVLPTLLEHLSRLDSGRIAGLVARVNPHKALSEKINESIVDAPPTSSKEGGIFRRGFSPELDAVLDIAENGKDWLLNYEKEQREETGIGNLKVRYNKVFGYFIEVTKANLSSVPESYIRKQTLTNAERFFTETLKEMEDGILGADENRKTMEQAMFEMLRLTIADEIPTLLEAAAGLAEIDVLSSFAELAVRNDYVRPDVATDSMTHIVDGRHPVVERTLKDERFIPNDTRLDPECFLQILTGPNMAGKSTIIRQVALITLMAQMGSYVPATSAHIGLVDKIFSRVGASDNLARGHSTFMVEMTETAHILRNATDKSLIILDEIGRGTSTFDGLSIAWAVAEFLHDTIGARTMFATHYHELTELVRTLEFAKNMSVAVKEYNDQIIFLRKLVDGQANRSYGIQVGRLAGLPQPVVDRAKQVLANLETGQFDDMGIPVVSAGREAAATRHHNPNQLSLFNASPLSGTAKEVLEELAQLDPNTLSPMEALSRLSAWVDALSQEPS